MREPGRMKVGDHHDDDWLINQVAPDFELIDAWRLPATGTLEEFADLPAAFPRVDPESMSAKSPAGALFIVREWLGTRFGWDDDLNQRPIPGAVEVTLRDRLPEGVERPADSDEMFQAVYLTDREYAGELSNSLVHAILHLAWVAEPDGETHQGQMGVYVKHRGRWGKHYMNAIAPFRHHIVYPDLLKRIDRAWHQR